MSTNQSRLSRRTVLRGSAIGAVGVAAALSVGCGDDDDDEPATTATEPSGGMTPDGGMVDLGEPKHFELVAGWYRGEEVEYYDFGDNTKLSSGSAVGTAPIWVFITGMDAQGNPQFVEGQHNIIDVVPGDAGYSDLWQVTMVTVPEGYEPDSIRSAAEVAAAGYEQQAVEMYVNCPVVPAGSTLEGGEALVQGWYKGQQVFYPDFGLNDPVAVPIWAFITGMDADGNPEFVEGQMNIIDLVPGDAGYSAFWNVNLVMVDDSYEANSITSAQEVMASAFEVLTPGIAVNCPVV